ncbi:hypothetical protein [Myroides marinus]|uniref:hypothetical protein n=1 Tax=Myroides marinus TaxID=703342 RepID=UPI002577FD72|nr:hypothetical protein [Myroides marinus]MDM1369228.1 hypothetical protein [Myroides marinus]MDM1370701.1 hypothetical protein [Myroides marinus]MDM1383664.1 hypothetical protein [Myroides marinus]
MKKYYIPGMFSIILLPMMCMWYFGYYDMFKQYGYYEISTVDMDNSCYAIELNSYYYDSITYKRYELTDNIKQNNKELKKADIELKHLFSTNDYNHGVKFIFNNKMKYSNYIKVLDILNYEKGKKFVFEDSLIFINDKYFNENRRLPIVYNEDFKDESLDLDKVEVTVKESNLDILSNLIGNYKYLLVLNFVLLVFFAFRDYNRRIKGNKKE